MTEDEALIAELEKLNAERTQTPHGWWTGEMYGASFRAVGNPEVGFTTPTEPDDADGMMDVWGGDKSNDDDNTPLICECGEPADAKFIALVANVLPRLLALAQAGIAAEKMRVALEKISRGPVMPPPDPSAHSWQAWGRFWHEQVDRLRVIAREALAAIRPEANPNG